MKTAQQIAPHRNRDKSLGLAELIAIALGGMIGGGIFTVLGIAVSMVGAFAPFAIAAGGLLALLAAYPYIKLGAYYQDEGATYAFFKRSFSGSSRAASLIGWYVIFGYISTLALYAYTFSAYVLSSFDLSAYPWLQQAIAAGVIVLFTLVNIWSVKGMGKIEDLMVYSKLLILSIIAFVLLNNSQTSLPVLIESQATVSAWSVIIVAALTFVAYEGFQLVINAVNEVERPATNIPRAIYGAIGIATIIYFIIALGAILTIDFEHIIANKEYALAAGTQHLLGHWGTELVILGAVLASSSAISSTLFGASRQMAVIAQDGFFPAVLTKRHQHIPYMAIITMAALAIALVFIGHLELILEFSSLTFLLVCVLVAIAHFRVRHLTGGSTAILLIAICALTAAAVCIISYELIHQPQTVLIIISLYAVLTLASLAYSRSRRASTPSETD